MISTLLNHINSKYYNVKQLNLMKINLHIVFGLLHANIASLNLHINDFRHTLSLLSYKFDVIDISDHKICKDISPSSNISIPIYNKFIFESSETTYGTDFYIKDNVDSILRNNLQFNCPGDFDLTSIEIQSPPQKN